MTKELRGENYKGKEEESERSGEGEWKRENGGEGEWRTWRKYLVPS